MGRGATGRARHGGGDGEWETRRGMTGKGATGWGRWGGATGRGRQGSWQTGEGEEGARGGGDFTDGYEMLGWTYRMPGWNEIRESFDFVYPCNAGYPS